MKKSNTAPAQSLANAQEVLIGATKELKAAQEAFQKAAQRLSQADDAHKKAAVAFSQQVALVRDASAVAPLGAL